MQRIHWVMNAVARAFAIVGGAVLSALILLTCVSVTGRAINTILHSDAVQGSMGKLADALLATGVGPILGDFEIVEAGIAFAIFAFIPLCQITGGHATVDVFTSAFPTRVNRFIQMVADALFAIVLIVIAWRLYEGMMSKLGYGETTYLLQIPVWWSYAASLAAAIAAALVGIYVAVVRVIEFLSGHGVLSIGGGGDQ
ncbi:TRAP transporter small permease [Sediminimonas sp.]|uniref:TRAP transporter small permease n=1 Tax=Sediminimonas sp. TaxID=2823379 RepID=UPI003458C509